MNLLHLRVCLLDFFHEVEERPFVEALSGNRAGDGRQGFPACAAVLWQGRAAAPGKLLLHRVERLNVRQLDREGLLARIAHDQQHEAVAVNDVHGLNLALFIGVGGLRRYCYGVF